MCYQRKGVERREIYFDRRMGGVGGGRGRDSLVLALTLLSCHLEDFPYLSIPLLGFFGAS